MGSPPPTNFPAPSAPSLPGGGTSVGIGGDASAGFSSSPSGPTLCGFGLPGFRFNASFRIPGFPPFPFPPKLSWLLALNCDLSNPIDASFDYGGGRKPNLPATDPEDV